MKMVCAYIRHEAFEPIRMELLEQGFTGAEDAVVLGQKEEPAAVQ